MAKRPEISLPDLTPQPSADPIERLRELLQAPEPDVGEISRLLQANEWGGDKTALLLALLIRWRLENKPAADDSLAAERAVAERNEELQALERFHPMNPGDIVPHTAMVREARQKWVDALTRRGVCARARARVAWVEHYLYWFFGRPRPAKCLGEAPGSYDDTAHTELGELFKALKLNPHDADSWRKPRVETQPRPTIRLRTASTIGR